MSSQQPIGRLQDRVALITGASSGLGRAIAFRFAQAGAKCFLVDKYPNRRNPVNVSTGKADDWNSRLDSATDPSGILSKASDSTSSHPLNSTKPTLQLLLDTFGTGKASFHRADLTIEAEVQSAVSACVQTYSRLDILVNSHGISVESTHSIPLRCHETSTEDFLLTQAVNLTSIFFTCKHTIAQLLSQSRQRQSDNNASGPDDDEEQSTARGRGWIVNVASVQGLTPYYATPSYCASKGAVVMLSKQIALDYSRDGIHCFALCPGFLNTDMTRNLQADDDKVRSVAERQPLRLDDPNGVKGSLGNVEDVARMAVVLASDDVKWMTGQAVVVDGGYSLT